MLNLLVLNRMPKPRRAESRWGCLANVYVVSVPLYHRAGSEPATALLARPLS